MRSRCYGLLAILSLALPASAQPDPLVRVRILDTEAPSEVRLEAMDGWADIEVDGRHRGGVWSGEPVTIARSDRAVTVRFGGAELRGSEVRVQTGRLRLVAGRLDRQYLGMVVARAEGGKLQLVNHTPTEAYVASVVASEFGFEALEGAKAQAVLARTYAVRRAGATPHYDLDDHQGSQVYRGLSAATATSRRAADETAGEVLMYRGQIAEAFYFSSSGGHTADNDVVWAGAPIPYLRGVPDPYDAVAPDHQWETSASRSTVLAALSRVAGGRVTGIEVLERSRSGRARFIRLIGGTRDRMTGPQFRRAVNAAAGARTVRSTRFDVSIEGDRYVFRGSGYGHGVGMSQFGALGMDRAGHGYREILAHYFLGTEIRGAHAADPGAGLLAVASPPPRSSTPSRTPERETSALRDRYAPPSNRRRPTPRVDARQAEQISAPPAARAPETASATPTPAPLPAASRSRRAAW